MLLNSHCTETDMRVLISWPSQVTFDATKVGNFHFVAELIRSYPDLIWEVDDKNRSIIHIAVLRRRSSIFTLIYELGSIKDFIATFEDEEGNNILHCASKLSPSYRLDLISGAALQMTHELVWFEEVKKIMMPSQIEKKNSNGKTPHELFTEEHEELMKNAEKWTKSTANNCMLISTLVATGVYITTFCIPGGNNKNTGTPNYLQKPTFLIFAISNATALISSSASILIFLSILISSYAKDEYFKSLPFMLLFGLIAQFISITSMMIAFSACFFITYYHGKMWVPNFISVLAFLPIPLFTFLLFPLWSDIIYSSYFCMSLFRPNKHVL
ncbi:putative ankyrin repeat-containing domain, PGG domain-containing protein [Lupinus albus]|uniref:Putative ankyrin repeat-containing domain, PGG domain-containing protein n=1 Tax=Lupinus albus TaxID=3870 RepID=A0A6A4PDR8_LUPAL|nr:putative ankyrin repeat-containing domain, PGG domain-containing protein [Lupinus albus]